MAASRPHFLTINYPFIAVQHSGGFEAGQVAATVGFAETLAPAHLARKNLWQEFFLLLFGAVLQQRRANQGVTEKVGAHGCPCSCELFVQHHTLQGGQAFTAVLFRPGRTNPSTSKQLVWPLIVELLARSRREFKTFVEPSLWEIRLEPGSNFKAKFFNVGWV